MARRQRLSETQIVELFDPPTEQRELVRHYTLSEADLAAIRRCRGDHNRLGHALMLCYLRYPGRPLRAGERPPEPLLAFVAEQIDVLPKSIDDYLASERNRQRHAVEWQDSSAASVRKRAAAELTAACCRRRSRMTGLLIWLVGDAGRAGSGGSSCRAGGTRTALHRGASSGPAGSASPADQWSVRRTAQEARRADQRREESGQNWLTWLRQMPEAATPGAMLGLIERLEHVRAIGIEPGRGHLVHQARLAQLAREADGPRCSMLPATNASADMQRWSPSAWTSPPA